MALLWLLLIPIALLLVAIVLLVAVALVIIKRAFFLADDARTLLSLCAGK